MNVPKTPSPFQAVNTDGKRVMNWKGGGDRELLLALLYVHGHSIVNNVEIAQHLGCTTRAVTDHIRELKREGNRTTDVGSQPEAARLLKAKREKLAADNPHISYTGVSPNVQRRRGPVAGPKKARKGQTLEDVRDETEKGAVPPARKRKLVDEAEEPEDSEKGKEMEEA